MTKDELIQYLKLLPTNSKVSEMPNEVTSALLAFINDVEIRDSVLEVVKFYNENICS